MSNRKKFKTQRAIRLSESDEKFLKDLSAELGISFAESVRECVKFTFTVAPVLNKITMWDAITNMSSEFLEEIAKTRLGDVANGNKSAETNKKI